MAVLRTIGNDYRPITGERSGEVLCQQDSYEAAVALSDNDVIEAGVLPAGHEFVDFVLITDELDTHATTPTLTLNVGTAGNAAGEDAIIDGAATGEPSNINRPNEVSAFELGVSSSDRTIYITVDGAPALGGTGSLLWQLSYRPADI